MRAFIQCNKEMEPISVNVFNAYLGCKNLGLDCIKFNSYEDLDMLYHSRNDIIIGGVGMIKRRLDHFGIEVKDYDYPEELKPYLKRDIWMSTINEVACQTDKFPVFVKSKEQKKMTGKVIKTLADLAGYGCDEDFEVFCSTPVNMKAEYRVFVRYGKVIDIKFYTGDWHFQYDHNVIENAINDFVTAPDAYCIDFAVTDKGETVLIEVNDAFACSSYGMQYWSYAKFLITRWCQIVGIPDEFSFI